MFSSQKNGTYEKFDVGENFPNPINLSRTWRQR